MPWQSEMFWTAVGIFLSALGVVLAIVFYLWSKNRKILTYATASTDWITGQTAALPGVQITVNGVSVTHLTSTTVTFYNEGNREILWDDFAEKAPLGLTVENRIFSVHAVSSNPNVSLTPTVNGQYIHIRFDFLKPRQFFRVTYLHDGSSILPTIWGELKTGAIRAASSPDLGDAIFNGLLALVLGLFSLFLFVLIVVSHPDPRWVVTLVLSSLLFFTGCTILFAKLACKSIKAFYSRKKVRNKGL